MFKPLLLSRYFFMIHRKFLFMLPSHCVTMKYDESPTFLHLNKFTQFSSTPFSQTFPFEWIAMNRKVKPFCLRDRHLVCWFLGWVIGLSEHPAMQEKALRALDQLVAFILLFDLNVVHCCGCLKSIKRFVTPTKKNHNNFVWILFESNVFQLWLLKKYQINFLRLFFFQLVMC